MSKYNHYAQELNKVAKAAFTAYKTAEKALQDARRNVRDNPPVWGMSAEQAAKIARYKADLELATNAERRAKWDLDNETTKLEMIRERLRTEIDADSAVNPTELDPATMELLKMGVFTPTDYRYHLENANTTPTMKRVLVNYASKAADEIEAQDGAAAAFELRSAIYKAKSLFEENPIDTFDKLIRTYEMTAHNPAMIDAWDQITAETIRDF